MTQKKLHILISPLDWGLGHAARCVPIIKLLIQAGHRVTLAGQGRSLVMLHLEFPQLEFAELPGFSPSYPGSGKLIWHLFGLLPKFVGKVYNEHIRLNKLIADQHFDIIISDNRYGLWNRNVKSILITHQIMVKPPKWLRCFEFPLYLISRLLISRFDECWIPDSAEKQGLSGDLSHKYALPKKAKFIGPLSRFENADFKPQSVVAKETIVVIISGPEPQRSIFENLIANQLSHIDRPSIIISGKPESLTVPKTNNQLKIFNHLSTPELQSIIQSSDLVVCRSGYSSIMDLQALGAKALFVPTPGQTEQIYLAQIIKEGGIALFKNQNELNLSSDITEALQYTGFTSEIPSLLNNVILKLEKK